jgi:AdoMet-dependent rRNA methyltransferase SPB1
MPVNSIIIGVDLAPIKPIPRVITFQSDITTEKCRATIRQHLKTWKADTVLHDGAPNVGTAWVQDAYTQAELVLQSMKLAAEFLVEGGTFVTKVFRSNDYNSLLWVFKQLFNKVEATKPPSSRAVSAEIFVVCRGFKAPKRIDPKFLDPRAVFAELSTGPAPNKFAKVYQPEIKKRKRDGYEEGVNILYKELPVNEFIQTADPIAVLGGYNRLTFDQPPDGDIALAALEKLPETTDEVRNCCADLQVLSKKEFKLLLKWRLRVRELFGLDTGKNEKAAEGEETVQVDTMDEEMKLQQELEDLQDKTRAKRKRERKKEFKQKQKDIVRMQLHMTAPMDIGMEQAGPQGEGSMFDLKPIDKTGALGRISKGKMVHQPDGEPKDEDSGIGSSAEDDESDGEEDRLDRELDEMYDEYKERKAETDKKYKAKKAKREHDDGEWEGLSGSDKEASDSESALEEESDDESEIDETESRQLLTDLDNSPATEGGLSKKAVAFFNQDVFHDVADLLDEPEDEVEVDEEELEAVEDSESDYGEMLPAKEVQNGAKRKDGTEEEVNSDGGFEVVRSNKPRIDPEDDWDDKQKPDGTLGKPYSAFDNVCSTNLSPRHRHHHRRSHDPGTRPRDGAEDEARHCR